MKNTCFIYFHLQGHGTKEQLLRGQNFPREDSKREQEEKSYIWRLPVCRKLYERHWEKNAFRNKLKPRHTHPFHPELMLECINKAHLLHWQQSTLSPSGNDYSLSE
ncbi:uncharacterized protein LOC144616521 [Panthera onca]